MEDDPKRIKLPDMVEGINLDGDSRGISGLVLDSKGSWWDQLRSVVDYVHSLDNEKAQRGVRRYHAIAMRVEKYDDEIAPNTVDAKQYGQDMPSRPVNHIIHAYVADWDSWLGKHPPIDMLHRFRAQNENVVKKEGLPKVGEEIWVEYDPDSPLDMVGIYLGKKSNSTIYSGVLESVAKKKKKTSVDLIGEPVNISNATSGPVLGPDGEPMQFAQVGTAGGVIGPCNGANIYAVYGAAPHGMPEPEPKAKAPLYMKFGTCFLTEPVSPWLIEAASAAGYGTTGAAILVPRKGISSWLPAQTQGDDFVHKGIIVQDPCRWRFPEFPQNDVDLAGSKQEYAKTPAYGKLPKTSRTHIPVKIGNKIKTVTYTDYDDDGVPSTIESRLYEPRESWMGRRPKGLAYYSSHSSKEWKGIVLHQGTYNVAKACYLWAGYNAIASSHYYINADASILELANPADHQTNHAKGLNDHCIGIDASGMPMSLAVDNVLKKSSSTQMQHAVQHLQAGSLPLGLPHLNGIPYPFFAEGGTGSDTYMYPSPKVFEAIFFLCKTLAERYGFPKTVPWFNYIDWWRRQEDNKLKDLYPGYKIFWWGGGPPRAYGHVTINGTQVISAQRVKESNIGDGTGGTNWKNTFGVDGVTNSATENTGAFKNGKLIQAGPGIRAHARSSLSKQDGKHYEYYILCRTLGGMPAQQAYYATLGALYSPGNMNLTHKKRKGDPPAPFLWNPAAKEDFAVRFGSIADPEANWAALTPCSLAPVGTPLKKEEAIRYLVNSGIKIYEMAMKQRAYLLKHYSVHSEYNPSVAAEDRINFLDMIYNPWDEAGQKLQQIAEKHCFERFAAIRALVRDRYASQYGESVFGVSGDALSRQLLYEAELETNFAALQPDPDNPGSQLIDQYTVGQMAQEGGIQQLLTDPYNDPSAGEMMKPNKLVTKMAITVFARYDKFCFVDKAYRNAIKDYFHVDPGAVATDTTLTFAPPELFDDEGEFD